MLCSSRRYIFFALAALILGDVQPVFAEQKDALISSLVLIDADTDRPIRELVPGEVLNLAALPTRRLNVEAEADPSVGKVVFRLNAHSRFRQETARPFAMAGDKGGDYLGWTPHEGIQEITAIPFRNTKAGEPYSIRFSVVDRAVARQASRDVEDDWHEPELPARARLNAEPAPPPRPLSKLDFVNPSKDAAKTCRGFVNHENGYLNVVCSHDFQDAVAAKVLLRESADGGQPTETLVCEFLNTLSPMITACASSLSLVASLRQGNLVVAIERKNGSRAALPVKVQ